MSTADLRAMILSRLTAHGVSPHHAARLAGLPAQTVRDYLTGHADLTTGRALKLAAAVGLAVTARPVRGFRPAPAPAAGRRKIVHGKS